ncbi:MAG: NifU family protein [Candidatus Zixiibacteriota bacterium]|jgi:Fe-S cluster biogenesis protein NfuA
MDKNTMSEVRITGQRTMDPNVCTFAVDRQLYADGSVDCRSAEMAAGSPLLEALFKIDGIREVLVYGDSLTIAKSTDEDWQELGQKIGQAIRETIKSGEPLIAEDQKERLPSEKQIKERVEALLAKEINPYVSGHGGRIDVVDVKGSKVYVHLQGGCQGCASANITLKRGVEEVIFGNIPEVTEVIDVTDHSAGTNPYYK